MLGQRVLQPNTRVGRVLRSQSWDTSHCRWKHGALACGIRSSAKHRHPNLPAALRGLGRAAALGWVCVCPSCPGLAGGSRLFQSLECCCSSGGCGDPALLQGRWLTPHAEIPPSHRGDWRKAGGSKKRTLQGERLGSAAQAVPVVQAWSQSCLSSKDTQCRFEVRVPQTLLGLWHPTLTTQIRQDASPCAPSLEQQRKAPALPWHWALYRESIHRRAQHGSGCRDGAGVSLAPNRWVKGCTDVPHSPLLLHPAQELHARWWMEKQTLLCASSRTFVPALLPMCWVAVPIQPLPTTLQSPRCLMELHPPDPAQVPDTVRLLRSPSAWHLGMFAPGLLARQRALGSTQVVRAGKSRSWDPQGLLFLPRLKPYPFPG